MLTVYPSPTAVQQPLNHSHLHGQLFHACTNCLGALTEVGFTRLCLQLKVTPGSGSAPSGFILKFSVYLEGGSSSHESRGPRKRESRMCFSETSLGIDKLQPLSHWLRYHIATPEKRPCAGGTAKAVDTEG